MEFEAITDDSGKLTAQNVTASDGSPCPGPEPRETRRRRQGKGGVAAESGDGSEDKTQGDAEKSDSGAKDEREKKGRNRRHRRRNRNGKKSKEENKSDAKQEEKSWHMGLEENVKKSLEDRSIKTDNGRAFLAMGDSRIKLGTLGYLAIAHTSGLLAEGTYTCDKDGKVTATWQHVLKYDGAEWKPSAADDEKEILVAEFSLVDGELLGRKTVCLWQLFALLTREFVQNPSKRRVIMRPRSGCGAKERVTRERRWRSVVCKCERLCCTLVNVAGAEVEAEGGASERKRIQERMERNRLKDQWQNRRNRFDRLVLVIWEC